MNIIQFFVLLLISQNLLAQNYSPKTYSYSEGRLPVTEYINCGLFNIQLFNNKTDKKIAHIDAENIKLLFSNSRKNKQTYTHYFKTDDSALLENEKSFSLDINIYSVNKPKIIFSIKNEAGKRIHKEKFLYRKYNQVDQNSPYYITDEEFFLENETLTKNKEIKLSYLIECTRERYHSSFKSWPFYSK